MSGCPCDHYVEEQIRPPSSRSTLETTLGQINGFVSQLLFKPGVRRGSGESSGGLQDLSTVSLLLPTEGSRTSIGICQYITLTLLLSEFH